MSDAEYSIRQREALKLVKDLADDKGLSVNEVLIGLIRQNDADKTSSGRGVSEMHIGKVSPKTYIDDEGKERLDANNISREEWRAYIKSQNWSEEDEED